MLAREFERESFRIDQLIWDAMALRGGETALFCSVSNNVDWIKRAVAIGVEVTVISNDVSEMNELQGIPISILRGSATLIPARDASFDVTVAFHYLHEIDPFFHANVVTELGRVGRRCVIVEPAPPSDALGLRIVALYSRAKRELGQFENYHHIEYWRKLLAIVKSDVTYQTFTFMRTPPREAIRETVALIIDMMAAEATPETYLAELRALAKRPDAQLVPQARFVVVGTAAGAPLSTSVGTDFRDRAAPELLRVSPFGSQAIQKTGAPGSSTAPVMYSRPNTAAEFPTVEPAPPTRAPAARPASPVPQIARNAFGLPAREEKPRRPVAPSVKGEDADAFGPPGEAADAAAEFGWEWETPKSP